jgi:hypothetical protein
MRIIIPIISLLISSAGFTQADSTQKQLSKDYRWRPPSKNWQEQLIDGIYLPQGFERYKGSITIIDDHTINYDGLILFLYDCDPVLRKIFETGIFYPGILRAYHSGQIIIKQEAPDSLNQTGKLFWQLLSLDSLQIDIIEQTKVFGDKPITRKFQLLVWRRGVMNPTEYNLELTNEVATKETDLLSFITGSRMTYFKKLGIWI